MTETAVVQKGVDTGQFMSRRDLVLRRFLRNEPAVVALILLIVLFVGCYALPPLLPYSYTDLDYSALQEPGGEYAAARLAVMSVGLGLGGLLLSEWFARRVRRSLGR